ncbi:hypothetical protein ACFOY2_45940 [Nonomuraea purpurea]|uniref:Uncharacterized protein n=1 Tax=Nonomuraea purpurea TaxID=1849276 RepID=A0ABV8GNU6_9ACTN
MNAEAYKHATEVWAKLGFDDFSAYADFMFNMAYGKWEEYGFKNRQEATDFLFALQDGAEVPPPHLRHKAYAGEQATLPLIETNAA